MTNQYNIHISKILLLFVLMLVCLCTSKVCSLTLPPWRGIRQLLSVGPWGIIFDGLDTTSSFTENQVLYVDKEGNTLSFSSASLLPPYCSSSHRRIVAVSDTHGKHRSLSIPECDVLCHCGDVLQRYGYIGSCGGGLPALLDFCSWLRDDIPTTTSKIVIGGNHDALLERLGDEAVKNLLSRSCGAIYLRDEAALASNLVFYGSPWSPSGGTGNRAFQRGCDAEEEVLVAQNVIGRRDENSVETEYSSHIDVLLTHAKGAAWESIINDNLGPRFWAHGHWHDGHGRTSLFQRENGSGCISVNVASNDMIYRPVNPPVVFDVPLRTHVESAE